MAIVVDASMAAAWILPDEHSLAAEALMPRSPATPARVPSLFWHEMRSVALMAERRGLDLSAPKSQLRLARGPG